MDDANVPDLLSLTYLGCLSPEDEIYKNTRKFILSDSNPYFFKGKAGEDTTEIVPEEEKAPSDTSVVKAPTVAQSRLTSSAFQAARD